MTDQTRRERECNLRDIFRTMDAHRAQEIREAYYKAVEGLSTLAESLEIPFTGGGVDDAIAVRPWGFVPDDVLPEKFEVMHPLVHNPVCRESLKVMRARYLLARDAYYGPMIHRFFQGLANDTNAYPAATECNRNPEDGN